MDNKKFIEIEKQMNDKFINRTEEIRGLLVTMLANGNMILLGKAGTAKTDMVQTLGKCVRANVFETLLAKTSSPEELFGPFDLRELENGNYVRNTAGTLVDSDLGFVDEVFKCNSAVLNGLLGVMAQRSFRNGGRQAKKIGLTMLVGASNELPDGGADGELAALWDRFEMRYVVPYLTAPKHFMQLIRMGNSEPTERITLSELADAQKEVEKISTKGIEDTILKLWEQLKEKGIEASDRKWRNSLRYIKANAFLNGRDKASPKDCLILAHILWQNPEDISVINSVVTDTCMPALKKVIDITEAAKSTMDELLKMTDDDEYNQSKYGTSKALKAAEVHSKVLTAKKRIEKDYPNDAEELKPYVDELSEMLVRITGILTSV